MRPSGIILGILSLVSIAIPLVISLPMVLETMARGDLAYRIHLHVRKALTVRIVGCMFRFMGHKIALRRS
jgi:hypothetical protein